MRNGRRKREKKVRTMGGKGRIKEVKGSRGKKQ